MLTSEIAASATLGIISVISIHTKWASNIFSYTLWHVSKIIWARCFRQKQGGRSQVIRPFYRQKEDGCTAELLWVAFSHVSFKCWATSDLDEAVLSDMCHRNHVFSWCLATRDKTTTIKLYQMSPEKVVLMEETAYFCPMSYDWGSHFLKKKSKIFTYWTCNWKGCQCSQPPASSLLSAR